MRKALYLPQPGKFTVDYNQEAIELLKSKIENTRYPDEIKGAEGKYGFSKTQVKDLLTYWKNDFDFSAHYERINKWNNRIEEIDGFKLHYILEKSGEENAVPIVLLHGWPSTFLQMTKTIPLLQKDVDGQSFDVVVISLPGYGFSDITDSEGMAVHKMADLMQKLMTETLGYDKFILRGSDLGAGVAKEWALAYPDNVLGLHLSGSSPYIFQMPEDVSKAEEEFIKKAQAFMQQNGAYASLHSTEPQTLAYALNDSPSGLTAWISQRYQNWTDNNGDLNTVYAKKDLLDILTIYWMTETINASMRTYYESATVYSPNMGKQVEVPTAFLMLKKDIATAPREWEARTYANILQWNENASGGHFAEWEKPELMVKDIREFTNSLLLN